MYESKKGAATLRISDTEGNALAGVKLHIEQTSHDFLFGCGVFDALPAANNKKGDAFCLERVQEWTELFNYGTLPFYWGRYEPLEGEPEYQSRMNAAKLLRESEITLKGHPLCWHTACAEWLMDYDNSTILKKQLERIRREVTAFKGVIDYWDVINEVVIMPVYDRYDNAITRICKEYGRTGLVKMVFEAAREANPNAVLLINDFNLSDKYAQLISDCLDAGVPIGAIGLQTHQHQGYMGREKLEEILARFEKFGLPLHFTENTLVSGHLMPPEIIDLNDYQPENWPTTREGEERQKKELEDMLRYVFDHPLVEAFTIWDFADGAWLGAPSGVIRKDNSKKPSYEMLMDLIHTEWHTDVESVTNENGCIELTGYAGNYVVVSDRGKAVFHLEKGKNGEIKNICMK